MRKKKNVGQKLSDVRKFLKKVCGKGTLEKESFLVWSKLATIGWIYL